MNLTSNFDVSDNHVEEDVPKDHCYDETHIESMTDEERGLREDSISKAENQTVLKV